LTRSGL